MFFSFQTNLHKVLVLLLTGAIKLLFSFFVCILIFVSLLTKVKPDFFYVYIYTPLVEFTILSFFLPY